MPNNRYSRDDIFARLGDWLVYFYDNRIDILRKIRDDQDPSLPWLPLDIRLSVNTLIRADHESDIYVEWEPLTVAARRPTFSWQWEEARMVVYALAVPVWRGDIKGNGEWTNPVSSRNHLWLDGLKTMLQIIEDAGAKTNIKAADYKEVVKRRENAELEKAAERLNFRLRQQDGIWR